ncbi:MAG: lamin tail domain-containing protein, partial [Anaerolineae bacterium]|nr:lamin tail domain-containing protein [Anaerolineae bacterium]
MLLASLGFAQAADPTELFFSEYIEGSSNNKALEIYNGTGAAINLAAGGYNVQMFFNGNPISTLTISLTGTVASGDVYVVAQSSADALILAQADQTNSSGWFNGDDAVVLRKGTTIIDVIGQIGFDPGSEWGAGLISTADNTIRRLSSVCAGDAIGTDAFDPSIEWEGFATNTFSGLGTHTATCGNPPTNPTAVAVAAPAVVQAGETTLLTVAVTPGENPTSSGITVTGNLSGIGGSATQAFYDDGTNGDATAGDGIFSYLAAIPGGASVGSYPITTTTKDAQNRTVSATITLKVVVIIAINQIQGVAHI